MTAEIFQSITRQGGCVDLSRRAKFRLTGADRVRYLNGQVTNDVRKAGAAAALRACVTNAKGRIEAEVFIHASPEGDALLLDTDAGLREALAMRLDRHIVADDVTLTDVTEEWNLVHCFRGSDEDGFTGGSAAIPPLVCSRFGMPGSDLWMPADSPLSDLACPVLSEDDAGTLRILNGIPAWPHELNGDAFPQEAGLESSAMDFAKGCYIGQEVLSRIKTTGKMPRVLRRLEVSDADWAMKPGMKLMGEEAGKEPKEAGVVTSVARHPLLDRQVGLAYVRQPFGSVDSLLLACEDAPRILGKVKITPL